MTIRLSKGGDETEFQTFRMEGGAFHGNEVEIPVDHIPDLMASGLVLRNGDIVQAYDVDYLEGRLVAVEDEE